MRKFYYLLVVSLFFLSSCASWKNVPEKLDKFVKETETSAKDFSEEEWEKNNAEYEEMVEMYNENKDKYSREEQRMAVRAMARYHALLVLNGIKDAASIVNDMKQLVPAYLKGISDAINETSSEIVGAASELFDVSEFEEDLTDLSDDILDLVNDISEEVKKSLEK